MTCQTCKPWCATDAKQLARRRVHMTAAPDVGVHACPNCGGTDWATTDESVADVIKPISWLEWFKEFFR